MRLAENQLDRIYFALSNPTRRAIIGQLAAGPDTVGRLAEPFDMSAPAITKHLHVLEQAGLVSRQVLGRQHHCRLNPEALETAQDWISHYREFWQSRLDELERMLEKMPKPSTGENGPPYGPFKPTKETSS